MAAAAAAATAAAPAAGKSSPMVRLWPPGQRTRSHVAESMAGNLKSLSAFYSPLGDAEASLLAARVEEIAFEAGEREAGKTGVSSGASNGSSAVRIYAKEASRLMLEALKNGGKIAGAAEKQGSTVTTVAAAKEVTEDDTAASAPETEELFDISGEKRAVMEKEKADELFAALAHGSFTQIRLSNWAFTKAAAEVAAEALRSIAKTLKKADISDIVAGRPQAEALEVMGTLSNALEGSVLKSLDLSNNALGEKGVRAFGSLLRSQHHLEELYFENNGISHQAASAIVELLPSAKHLKVLHFHNNMSGTRGAEELAKLVREATMLEDFKFSSSRVRKKGGISIAEALKSGTSLKKLDLRDNMYGSAAGVVLASSLKQHTSLRELYLADLGLRNKGVEALLQALAPCLEVLDLGNNDLTPSIVPQLAAWVEKLQCLKKLSLAENEIKDGGVVVVCKALERNHEELEELDLTLTGCRSQGAIAAADAVKDKKGFKELILESNCISDEGVAEVEKRLAAGVGSSVLRPMEDNNPEDEDEENEDEEEDEAEEDEDEESEEDDEAEEGSGENEQLQTKLDGLAL